MTENKLIACYKRAMEVHKEEFGEDSEAIDVYKTTIELIEEIQQYRAIGTVEECWEARERQRAKKINNRKLLRNLSEIPYSVRGDCPNCGSIGLLSMDTNYCNACGQKLDWNE